MRNSSRVAGEAGLTFTPDSKVVLEEFRKVYHSRLQKEESFGNYRPILFSKAKHDIISLFEEVKLLNLE